MNFKEKRIYPLMFMLISLPLPVFAAASVGGNDVHLPQNKSAVAKVENLQTRLLPQQENVSFTVQKIAINQETKFNEKVFKRFTNKYLNRKLTLADLDKLSNSVTDYCRAHGYPAATAYVPEQTLTNGGTINLNIAAGRYGKIGFDNERIATRKVIRDLVTPLKPGAIITTQALETVLYNINDIGGINAAGILSPGKEIGTSDLTIRTEKGKLESILVYVNNYGNTSAGRYRYGVQGDFYGIGRSGGHLTAGGFISNKNQHNYNLSYSEVVGRDATRLGIGFSRTDYELGGIFKDLEATGGADTYSIYGDTPLWRTLKSSMRVVYGYDFRRLHEEVRKFGYNVEKHSHTLHAGLVGHIHNGKANFGYNLTGYTGTISVGDDSFNLADRPDGRFTKGTYDLSLQQQFDDRWDMLLKVSGQEASTHIDSSEGFYLGGPSGVRAYPQGEANGDSGYQASAELRYHTHVPGLTLSAYLDSGHVNFKGPGSSTTLYGWGLGITYAKPQDWYVRFDYARRIGLGDDVSEEANAHGRMWFLLGKLF